MASILKFTLPLVVLASIVCAADPAPAPQPAPDFKSWGFATLQSIEKEFALPKNHLYANKIKPGEPTPSAPASMWNCGVQLSALVAAAKLDQETYLPLLRNHIKGMDAYWQTAAPAPGYDPYPKLKTPDRYYDDNLWIVLGLTDAYELTSDPALLDRAQAAFKFALTGEDDTLGGGLYWREKKKTMKAACSNAPAITAALRLYQLTSKKEYLETATRLYSWINAHLQDSDGLYFDNIKLDGAVEKRKWTYNTALMIRANVLLSIITKETKYLTEAQRLAKAAEAHWISPDTGAIADGAMFAHLLTESFLALYQQDHDQHWRDTVQRALTFVHEKTLDPAGHYNPRWDAPPKSPLTEINLIHQSSAARAFLIFAAQ